MQKNNATGAVKSSRRIVVYGRPSSGKTCFMAALGMARLPHHAGYSCTWVTDTQTIPTPSGKREDWDANDPVVGRFLGREWLLKSINALKSGDVPRANANDVTPYRLLFDITQPDGRMTRVEMVDYSGELVDPNLAEDVLARQLLAHLEMADGILVLGEAPENKLDGTGDQLGIVKQYSELQILQQAFVLVAEKRRKGRADPIPVALLLNKWDRFTKMKEYDPDVVATEVEMFLERKPAVPQKGLLNVLRAVAGMVDGQPCSAKFAISAFGRSKRILKDGRDFEVPASVTPLESYGLEDPLVWVCQAADELEMRKLEIDVASLGTWKVWQAVGRRALQVRSEALEVRKKVPSHLPESARLAGIASRALKAFGKQTLFAASFFAACIFSTIEYAVYAHDSHCLAQINPSLEAARAGSDKIKYAEDWKRAEAFLTNYATPSWWRLASHTLKLSPESARNHLADLQPLMMDAERILALRAEFDTKIDEIVKAAEETPVLERVEALRLSLDAMERPNEYPNAGAKLESAKGRMHARLELVRADEKGRELRGEFQEYLRKYEFAQAASLISKHEGSLPQMAQKLRSEFKDQWAPLLTEEVRRLCASKQDWDRAEILIQNLTSSKDAVTLIGGVGQQVCDQLKTRVKTHRANCVYRDFFRNRENPLKLEAALNYGDTSGRTAARKWKEYRDWLYSPRDWTISLAKVETWAHGAGFVHNYKTSVAINLYADGNNVANESQTFNGTEYRTLSASGTVSSKTFREELTVKVYFSTTSWFNDISGSGTWTGRIIELSTGRTIRVSLPGATPDPDVVVRIAPRTGSIMTEPVLPQPKEDGF